MNPASSKAVLFLGLITLMSVSPRLALADTPAAEPRYGIDIGAGAISRPRYEGSAETVVRAVPLLRAFHETGAGKFSFGEGGLAWSIKPHKQFELGASIAYSRGRKESASHELAGLGSVAGGAELGLFGAYQLGPVELRASGKTASAGASRGNATADFQIGYRTGLTEKLGLQALAGLNWANRQYMQDYFGVSQAQSARSGLAVFSPESGFKSAAVGLNLSYRFGAQFSALASWRGSVLLGDANDSPVSRKREQNLFVLGLNYHWRGR